jgi:hypothetical protein
MTDELRADKQPDKLAPIDRKLNNHVRFAFVSSVKRAPTTKIAKSAANNAAYT